MAELMVIVPTRGRPESVARVAQAWRTTGAFEDGAEVLFAVDADDQPSGAYLDAIAAVGPGATAMILARWMPMVHKLDHVARHVAREGHFALGFAGDDHLPRTRGWARQYVDELRQLGTGIVYGDDGYQGENLPTQWAMTADIVRTLDRMVPAPVEHLYCDNAIRDLGQAAGCLRYLPDVLIEHMHPVAGKAPTDAQYERVNDRGQYAVDREAYRRWRRETLPGDAAAVAALQRTENHAY